MAKPKAKRALPENCAQAVLRNLRTSPRKANLVAGLIRGKHVEAAIRELTFCKRRIAEDVKKVLLSAVANAENNHGLDIDNLYVKEAHVGKALVMKRFHVRGRGRVSKILKPFSHVTVVVEEKVAV